MEALGNTFLKHLQSGPWFTLSEHCHTSVHSIGARFTPSLPCGWYCATVCALHHKFSHLHFKFENVIEITFNYVRISRIYSLYFQTWRNLQSCYRNHVWHLFLYHLDIWNFEDEIFSKQNKTILVETIIWPRNIFCFIFSSSSDILNNIAIRPTRSSLFL